MTKKEYRPLSKNLLKLGVASIDARCGGLSFGSNRGGIDHLNRKVKGYYESSRHNETYRGFDHAANQRDRRGPFVGAEANRHVAGGG